MVQAIVGILNQLRLTPSRIDTLFAIFQSNGTKEISFPISSNKELQSCEVISETPQFSCTLISPETLRVTYTIEDTRFFSEVFQGRISVLTKANIAEQESTQVPVIFRIFNFSNFPRSLIILISVLVVFSMFIFLNPKIRKSLPKNAKKIFTAS